MSSKKERPRNEEGIEEEAQPPDKDNNINNINGNNQQGQEVQKNNLMDNFNNVIYESQNGYTQTVSIILMDQYEGYNTFEKNVDILIQNKTINGKTGKYVMFQKLLNTLRDQRKHNFDDYLLSYFNTPKDLYVFVGMYPLDDDAVIPIDDAIAAQCIQIKMRSKKRTLEQKLKYEQDRRDKTENQEDTSIRVKQEHESKNGRVKERKIGEVVEKVALWRRFYTGFFEDDGKFVSYQLEDAAKKVGISKKTLDDYLLQIRCGKKYGFDFNKNKDERIGALRSFVKQEKEKDKGKQK